MMLTLQEGYVRRMTMQKQCTLLYKGLLQYRLSSR